MDRKNEDDVIILGLIVILGIGFGAFGGILAPVRAFFLQWKILVQGDTVLLPVYQDIGFDIWRILILAGAVLVALVGLIAIARHRARSRHRETR